MKRFRNRSREAGPSAFAPIRAKIQRHSILFNFLLPYLALLAIPMLVMSVFLFRDVSGVLEARTLENSLANLKAAQQQIDMAVEDLVKLNTAMADGIEPNVESAYERFAARQQYRTLLETNSRLEAIYDYWNDSGYIISTGGIYDLDKPYASLDSGSIPIDWFISCVEGQETAAICYYGDDLFFVYPSAEYRYFDRHAIVFQLKAGMFLDMLGGGDVTPAILSAQGELIAGHMDEIADWQAALGQMDGSTGTLIAPEGNVIIAYVKSGLTGWTLVHIHDMNVVMSDLMQVELTGVALILAIAILGGLVILPSLKATYKPLASITKNARQQSDAGDITSFNMLARRLEHIYATNRELSSFSNTCRSMLKSQLFTSIERGLILDAGDFWPIARIVTGGEACSSFDLILVRIRGHEERDDMFYEGFLDMMKQYVFPEGNIIFKSSVEQHDRVLAMLLNGDAHDGEELVRQSRKLLDATREDGAHEVSLLISTGIGDIKGVRQRYFAGMEALFREGAQPIELLGEGGASIDSALRQGQRDVARLEEHLVARRLNEAHATLQGMASSISAYCSTSAYWAKYIGYDIMSTVLRYAQASVQAPTESMMLNLEAGRWQAFIDEIDRLIMRDEPIEPEDYSANMIVDDICRCVDERLADASFGIQDIAEAIGYSYKYTSHVFRQQTGGRLSEYITRRRVDKFKELLANSESPIGELIRKVGFENPATFHRLFKQIEGITPGQYRQKLRLEQRR